MDTTVGLSIVIILIAVGFFLGLRSLFRVISRYRGTQIVTCPETNHPAMVEVDALQATLSSAVGRPTIQLQNCSRWPLKEHCGQECLAHLEVAPTECLVNGLLSKWYEGKQCCYCHVTFNELHWADHQPALRSTAGELRTWSEVSLSEIFSILSTHQPVCWNCYIAQSFILQHPDLVVYRPWRDALSPSGSTPLGPSVSARQRH